MTKHDKNSENTAQSPSKAPSMPADETATALPQTPQERGGPKGPEPTRFGDWESGGRCTDF